ncbi:MAG: ParB/RepB/Spo0J family partition protein [Candidatus Daviesbacteria bacterium]|nr:ParB/RepB/Spo0J family partition protein [Candidatus Daviesbacteria bacterium]
MDNQPIDSIFELDINMLEPNPLQPRGLITPESLAELSESIREHGILEPIVVAKTPAGYQIIAGERRWRASKLAGLKRVPVMIKETTPRGMLEMAIVENVQRQDLNPLERAQAYKRLLDEFSLTNGEISQRVGKSPAYISNTIRLLTIPDALKDALMSGQTTEGHVRALSSLDDPHLIIEGYKEVLRRSLSVRGAEDLVRRMKAKYGVLTKKTVSTDKMHIINDDVESIQQGLTSALSTGETKAAVKYVLTPSYARVEIRLTGKPDSTHEKFREFIKAINSYTPNSG